MFELTPFMRHPAERYNPFGDLEEFEKNFFGRNAINEFKTDIRDEGDNFVLEADLPGFTKDNIHVDLDDGYMTISAERHSSDEEKDKKGNIVRSERAFGSFTRSFNVSGIAEDKISAAYENGVLTLTLPKKQPEAPSARRLEIQ